MDDIIYTVYALEDPRSKEIKYVGLTKNLKNRITRHVYQGRHTPNLNERTLWLKSLLDDGFRPGVLILEKTTNPMYEKYWIRYFWETGQNLTNISEGGDSHPGCVIHENTRKGSVLSRKGVPISDKHRAALIKSLTGRPVKQSTLDKLIEASHRRKNSATHCRNGHEFTPENTKILNYNGYRVCRICRNNTKRKTYHAHKKVKTNYKTKNNEDFKD